MENKGGDGRMPSGSCDSSRKSTRVRGDSLTFESGEGLGDRWVTTSKTRDISLECSLRQRVNVSMCVRVCMVCVCVYNECVYDFFGALNCVKFSFSHSFLVFWHPIPSSSSWGRSCSALRPKRRCYDWREKEMRKNEKLSRKKDVCERECVWEKSNFIKIVPERERKRRERKRERERERERGVTQRSCGGPASVRRTEQISQTNEFDRSFAVASPTLRWP